MIGPIVIEPLAQTHVPKMVQNLALKASSLAKNTSLEHLLSPNTYQDHNHQIVKRALLAFDDHDRVDTKTQRPPGHRDDHDRVHDEMLSKINKPKSITPDPLLVQLFASDITITTRLVRLSKFGFMSKILYSIQMIDIITTFYFAL